MIEAKVVRRAGIEDLNEMAFRRHLHRLGLTERPSPDPETLRRYREFDLVARRAEDLRPTVFGILAFGWEPQRFPHMHSFLVRCTAYETPRRNRR